MKERYDIKQLGFIPPPYGGVSVHLKRLIDRLNADGYSAGGYYLPENKDAQVHASPMFHSWKWLQTKAFFSRIFSLANEVRAYRIVHSHFSLEGMLYLWMLQTVWRKKIIVTVHNSMVGNYFQHTNPVNRFFLRLMADSDVQWIAVSEQARDGMMQLPLRFRNKIEVIPAYIPIRTDPDEQQALPDALDNYVGRHKQIITFYGHSFMYNSGVDVYGFLDVLEMYAEAVSQGAEAGLVYCVADPTDTESLNLVKSHAEALGIASRIYWQEGPLKNMQPLWRVSDVYARPTSTDGDSIAVREALDIGTRVVASNVCSRPAGVAVYEHGNNQSFTECVMAALQQGRAKPCCDLIFYQQILQVYKRILKVR